MSYAWPTLRRFRHQTWDDSAPCGPVRPQLPILHTRTRSKFGPLSRIHSVHPNEPQRTKDVPLLSTSPRMDDALCWFRLNRQEPVSTISHPGSGPGATEPTDLLLLDPLLGSWNLSQLQLDHCGTFARWLFVDYSTTVSSSRGGVVLTRVTAWW